MKEVGIKELKRLPINSKVKLDMIGKDWIDSHRKMWDGKLIMEDGFLKIQTSVFTIPVKWKSDVPKLSFKIYI